MKLRLFRLFGMALVLLLVGTSPSSASAHAASGPRPPWWPFAIAFPEIKLEQSQQLMSGPPAQVAPAPNPAPVIVPPGQQGTYYTVTAGDTLSIIAQRFGVTTMSIVNANNIADADHIVIGQRLLIPGATSQPKAQSQPAQAAPAAKESTRGSAVERQTYAARMAPPSSPFYATTWVTYYGRPNVPILGILGEYNIDTLTVKLRNQARAYDVANGPQLDVTPAYHLIYGMATVWKGSDGSYLNYMSDESVKEYIRRAQQEGFGVILDVQIGALTPLAAIKPVLRWLDYDNVHLAIDPEFAMSTAGQTIPGQPPGSVTAGQVNQVQAAMSSYLQANGISGRRMLIVHQFLPWMIDDTSGFYGYTGVDLVVCADGFGPPWPKVSKYNLFMDQYVPFTGFKLFYGWDEPLMTERQALGVDPYPGVGYMDVTPNLIIYQ